MMKSPAVTRVEINALHSKLSGHSPFLKGKLRQALNLLDDYEKTGIVYSLHWAVQFHKDVVNALEKPRSEQIETAR
jgi:hypothetical protein